MRKEAFTLRFVACIMWMAAGILTGTIDGYISAVASVLFIVAMVLELSKA